MPTQTQKLVTADKRKPSKLALFYRLKKLSPLTALIPSNP